MKLLVVFPQYPAETFAVTEVDALRRAGIDVQPVVLRWNAARVQKAFAAFGITGAEVVRTLPLSEMSVWSSLARFVRARPGWSMSELGRLVLENWRSPAHLAKSLFVAVKAPALGRLADEIGADGVHIFWGHYPSVVVPFLKAAAPTRPVSVFVGAYTAVNPVPSQERALAQADCLTTHFEGHVGIVRQEWPHLTTPIAMVYRGLDLTAAEKRRAAFPSVPESSRIGVVCRLVSGKKIDHAIRAFSLLGARRPRLQLDIIGDGPDLASLQSLAAELGVASRVKFHGKLAYQETLAVMSRLAVLLMPSLSEFYPNVIKEAMALGVPCAAYGIRGIKEYVVGGAEVRLAPPGRIDAIAQAVADLLDDPELRASTIEQGLVRVRDFDVRMTSRLQADLFEAMAAHTPLPSWVDTPDPIDPTLRMS